MFFPWTFFVNPSTPGHKEQAFACRGDHLHGKARRKVDYEIYKYKFYRLHIILLSHINHCKNFRPNLYESCMKSYFKWILHEIILQWWCMMGFNHVMWCKMFVHRYQQVQDFIPVIHVNFMPGGRNMKGCSVGGGQFFWICFIGMNTPKQTLI